jgi:hypothetical protein
MTTFGKPVHTLEQDAARQARATIHAYLLAVTEQGAKAVGCTGAAFVTSGLGIWAGELAELDPKATAQFLRAVADIFDPEVKPQGKARAEKKRAAAVRKLLAAVDLDMATPEGRC